MSVTEIENAIDLLPVEDKQRILDYLSSELALVKMGFSSSEIVEIPIWTPLECEGAAVILQKFLDDNGQSGRTE